MLFEITHRTRYHYSLPVSLEPFTLRLRPRSDATQSVRDFRLNITPQPNGISHCIGLDGNNTTTIWFDGPHENLLFEVHAQIETHYPDPFNFIITYPDALTLPLAYPSDLIPALTPYLIRDEDSPQVHALAQELMHTVDHRTIPFLTLLSAQIYQRFEYLLREHGDPWTPAETMNRGQGSCRDVAMLFIDVCRKVGIAARFVSGYCIGDKVADSHMHAWAEVYLPGAGWRGFDPSLGLSVSEDHITVAAGRHPLDAAPTHGHFRGLAASSMEVEIQIIRVDKS